MPLFGQPGLFARLVENVVAYHVGVGPEMISKRAPQLYRKTYELLVFIERDLFGRVEYLAAVVLPVLRAVGAVQIEYGVDAVLCRRLHELVQGGKIIALPGVFKVGYRREVDVHVCKRQPDDVYAHLGAVFEVGVGPPVAPVFLPQPLCVLFAEP